MPATLRPRNPYLTPPTATAGRRGRSFVEKFLEEKSLTFPAACRTSQFATGPCTDALARRRSLFLLANISSPEPLTKIHHDNTHDRLWIETPSAACPNCRCRSPGPLTTPLLRCPVSSHPLSHTRRRSRRSQLPPLRPAAHFRCVAHARRRRGSLVLAPPPCSIITLYVSSRAASRPIPQHNWADDEPRLCRHRFPGWYYQKGRLRSPVAVEYLNCPAPHRAPAELHPSPSRP
ncbi:hypothetical protein VUR80DRAFT_1000 [Thermomyces stellatus]